MTNINVPTNWKEMRYCIVAALQCMGDDGPWYMSDLEFEIERLFSDEDSYVDWDERAPSHKAFMRAIEALLEAGVVTRDDVLGYRLSVWEIS